MRKRKEILKWMIDQDITGADVARGIGVDRALVSRTIKGTDNNRRVLRRLLDLGCPAALLALPKDMMEAA